MSDSLRQTATQGQYSNFGVEFYIEPLYGLRVWNLYDHQLFGLRGWSWHPGVNVATCRKAEGDTCSGLDQDCACGFYAFWHRPRALPLVTGVGPVPGAQASITMPRIYGVVKSYGRIVVGKRGYRAEKSEVVALAEITSTWWIRPQLKRFARIPAAFENVVPYFESVDQMIKEYPCSKPV